MTNRFLKCLKGHDQLGQSVEFSHKKHFGFGTAIGGACSLLVTIFFVVFRGAGERVPADGVVVSGASGADESLLTKSWLVRPQSET